MASGLFITVQAFGDIAGPILSSQLAESYGFKIAAHSFACGLAAFALLYFLCCGHVGMCAAVKSQPEEEQELVQAGPRPGGLAEDVEHPATMAPVAEAEWIGSRARAGARESDGAATSQRAGSRPSQIVAGSAGGDPAASAAARI